MEGAEVHAIATTTAKILVIGDKAQLVMPEGSGRANLNTGSIAAVHAGSAVKEPVYFSSSFHFPELDFEPGFGGEVRGILVTALIGGFDCLVLIPLLARYLASPTSRAQT